jgi:hypothetical protein
MTKHSKSRLKRHINCLKCIELSVLNRIPKPQKRYSRSMARYTLDQYNQMFQDQKGLCLGCYKHQSELDSRLVMDHCHKTEKLRGLLCNRCNGTLGFARDNSDTLRRLADYIDKSRGL